MQRKHANAARREIDGRSAPTRGSSRECPASRWWLECARTFVQSPRKNLRFNLEHSHVLAATSGSCQYGPRSFFAKYFRIHSPRFSAGHMDDAPAYRPERPRFAQRVFLWKVAIRTRRIWRPEIPGLAPGGGILTSQIASPR